MSSHIFMDPARSGVFRLPVQEWPAIEAAAGAAGLRAIALPLGQPAGMGDALREIGHRLGFPGWYGANLDALHDCLTDPDWHSAAGQVLFVSGLEGLRDGDPDGFSTLIDVFRSASEIRSPSGAPLWVLLDTPAADLTPLPKP